MKIIIKELKDNLIYIYFLSILFEAICLFKVSTFDVTVPFVVSLLLMLVSVLDLVLSNYKIGKRNFFIFCLFVLVIVLNLSFAKGGETNYNSLFLHCYYIVFFFLTGHGFHKEKFDKALDRYITLVFVFSIYAIYQFVAYNFLPQLPLKELIPSALLTRNYNTIARTHFFGQVMYRGHSIFLEPSYLSQFTAVSILLLLNQARCGIWRKNFWLIMIVNALAFATALAGTGVIILFAGMVYFLFISKMKKSMKILLFSAVGIGALLILPTEIGSYFLSRSGEISFAKSNTSGYYRFVIPFLVAGDIITKNFFGYGMGNDELAILPYKITETRLSNGYGKTIAEIGVPGFISLLILLYSIRPRIKDPNLVLLYVIILTLNMVSANFVLSIFWCFALLLNINYKYVKEGSMIQ